MQIMVDNPTLPLSPLLSGAFGYLLGLGFVGYITLWAWIKERGARSKWGGWLTNLIIGLHLIFGLSAVGFTPAILLHRLKVQGALSPLGAITFAAIGFAILGWGLLSGRDWYRWFRELKSVKATER
ncbi:MAG: hypothetical protein JWL65_3696 [Gammaproteobacteria bacterium]|nr:hypothetical protein [Gammaproteobacteria bacterium]